MRTRAQRIARVIAFLPVFLLVFAALVWAVSALWNALMPSIFGLRAITYWQALGLMALSWILFRGFRGPALSQGPWRYEMRRRWARMTPEEREEFMDGVRSRWHDMRERWRSMTPEDREESVHGVRSQWHELRELWGRLTPQEREEFLKNLRSRWAGTKSPEPEPKP